jgi:hypothetical protein
MNTEEHVREARRLALADEAGGARDGMTATRYLELAQRVINGPEAEKQAAGDPRAQAVSEAIRRLKRRGVEKVTPDMLLAEVRRVQDAD